MLMLAVSEFLQIRTLPQQIELVAEPATFHRHEVFGRVAQR